MDVKKILDKAIKKLKTDNSLPKNIKINDKTLLTGDKSPFDSVAFVQFTSYIELEVSKQKKKNFLLMLFEIPEIKKNKVLTLGSFKKYLESKI
tara:strand:- start:346 stop:624 length:279 start_codon:yes stop_codon:yes gene_type:complete